MGHKRGRARGGGSSDWAIMQVPEQPRSSLVTFPCKLAGMLRPPRKHDRTPQAAETEEEHEGRWWYVAPER